MLMAAAFAYNRAPRTANGPLGTSMTFRGGVPPRVAYGTYFLVLLTALMIGLRHEVDGDWLTYLDNYDQIHLLSFSQVLGTFDVG
jgi:hypothetical protein